MEKIIYTESIDGELHEVHTVENGIYDIDYFQGELFKHNSGGGVIDITLDNNCLGQKEVWYDKEHINLTLTGRFVSEECKEGILVDSPHISQEDFDNLIEEDLAYRELEITITKNFQVIENKQTLKEILNDIEKIDTFSEIIDISDERVCLNFSRDSKGYNNVFIGDEFNKIEHKYNVSIQINFDNDFS